MVYGLLVKGHKLCLPFVGQLQSIWIAVRQIALGKEFAHACASA